MTWQSMETAPKGFYKTVKMTKGTKKVFHKEMVHTWRKDGHRTISYFSPETNAWAGYTKDSPPDMWHPFPDSPEKPNNH